jgi:IS30 family transposase
MLRMLDRHAIQELRRAGVPVRQIARQFKISRWTVRRIAREEAVGGSDEAGSRAHRGIGRPRVAAAVRARVAALVADDPTVPPGEIARRLREEGTPLGLSTVYRVLGGVRAALPAELQVRFEGLAGEFGQF